MPISQPSRWCFFGAAVALLLTSCTYSYTAEDGARRVIGLVDMTIQPPHNDRDIAGDLVDIRSIGIGVHESPQSVSFTLGYHRHVSALLRDNALVLGNPLSAIQNHMEPTNTENLK